MFNKRASYETKGGPTEDIDQLSQRLAVDLRKHLRALQPYPTFSKEWFDMVENLNQVANVAFMEQKLPGATGSGTLWDRDEMTVRFLLEEGKLNLCIRIFAQFKKFLCGTFIHKEPVAKGATQLGIPVTHLESQMIAYEQGMGVLLKCALDSVECVQTVDMPVLCDHIAHVLNTAIENPPAIERCPDLAKRQEVLVLYYLRSVLNRVDDLPEGKIMNNLEPRNLVARVITHTRLYKDVLPEGAIYEACCFLSQILQQEEYLTHKDKFIPEESRKELLELESTVSGFVSSRDDGRRQLRSLNDAMLMFKM